MATAHFRTRLIQGLCPTRTSPPAPSPTSSTRSRRLFQITRLEPDLEDLLWSTVNIFHIGSPWRPRFGSKLSHRALTAAIIDSRDFLAARHRAESEVLMPPGPKIALTAGLDFNDHRLIWAKLDQVYAKHPDMVLLHGGSPKGAELIAAKWASNRKVPQVAFKPDWTKHGKAAPFKRNDAILETLPIGMLHFPGTGIQDNLADKAKKLGIPVWRFGGA